VPAPSKNPALLLNKNTELAVRLRLAEEQNRLLREETQKLKQLEQAYERLKSEISRRSSARCCWKRKCGG
jgi:hypothetical protein